MNFKKFCIKKISLLLMISLISINFSFLTIPKKASAQWAVTDPGAYVFFGTIAGTTGASATANLALGVWETLKKYVVDAGMTALARAVALQLVRQITEATVNWINNGFNGNPAYVSNLGNFLTGPGGVADRAVGDFFANEPGLRFLCDPFRVQVLLALQLGYGSNLTNNLGCTLSGISRNVQNAADTASINANLIVNGQTVSSFTSSGGWNSWLTQTLQPQNNPVGAYLIAKDAMDTQIKNQTNSASNELIFGQGALSFKRCIDTYRDANGNKIGSSVEYTDGAGNKPIPPSPGSSSLSLSNTPNTSNQVFTTQNCTVKTPGSTITSMLGFKANSAGQVTELQAATAQGIDSILGAVFNNLFNTFINAALDRTQNGILDTTNTPAQQAYINALSGATSQIQNSYNNQVNQIYDGTISDPSQFLGSGFNLITTPSSTNTNDTGSSTSGGYVSGGYSGGYGYDALTQAQNNANNLVESLLGSEATYQNNYLTAQNLLKQAESVFATSSLCNMNANRNDYTLRSLLIRANVISNIEGIPDENRNVASIPWNLKTINTALDNSDSHVKVLDKASSDVNSASSVTAVKDAMIPVNSTSFNINNQSDMVKNIKTWLVGVQKIYTSPLCPIDLTKVLEITSATSTVN